MDDFLHSLIVWMKKKLHVLKLKNSIKIMDVCFILSLIFYQISFFS